MHLHHYLLLILTGAALTICVYRFASWRCFLASLLGVAAGLLVILFCVGVGIADTWLFYPYDLPWIVWLLPAALLCGALWNAWRAGWR